MGARAVRSVVAVGLLAAAALTGCGGSDASSTSTATHAQAPGADSSQPEADKNTFTPKPHHDSGGGSKQFVVKGADNSIQEFGQETKGSEFEAAATALHGFLDARAAGDWAAACSYLSSGVVKSFAQLSPSSQQPQGRGCAATLAAFSKGVPASALAAAAQADVGSLRREASQGFLIYRGAPKGTIYAISVAREGDSWKLAALAGSPLN